MLIYLVCVLCFDIALSHELPPYIKKCSQRSPKFQQCIKNQIPTILKELKEGDEELGLIPLEPLELKQKRFNLEDSCDLIIKNFHLEGLTNAKVKRIFVDPDEDSIEMTTHHPKIYISTNYVLKGNILGVDVDSVGPAEMHLGNVTLTLKIEFYRLRRNRFEYYSLPDEEGFEVDIKIGRHGMRFENLVPNDSKMNDFFNKMINNNFKAFYGEIKGILATVVRGLMDEILEPLLSKVPIKDLYDY